MNDAVNHHPKRKPDLAYEGLQNLLEKNPHLKNSMVAKRLTPPPGNGLPERLRAMATGSGKPTKAQIEKQKQADRLAELGQ
jgi:hypothetical protein